jgi:diguanylate cyclase (GGDEF)-like protein
MDKTSHLPETDPLTGLRSRDGLQAELAAHPSICCLIDIDQLLWLNDQLGFDAGDRALVTVANYLKASLGERARSMFRVGGDELLVVLRSDDLGAAREIARGIVAGVRALGIPYRRLDRPLRTVVEANVIVLPGAALATSLLPAAKGWIADAIYTEKLRTASEAGVVADLTIHTPMMTVGKLKALLAHTPDDVVVVMSAAPSAPHGARLQGAWPSYRGGPILELVPAKRLSDEFVVRDLVEIRGRGTAILAESLVDGTPGQRLSVEIERPDGSVSRLAASLEVALWTDASFESPAFMVDAKMADVPIGSKVRVV